MGTAMTMCRGGPPCGVVIAVALLLAARSLISQTASGASLISEMLSGDADGRNTVFTVNQGYPDARSVLLFRNGLPDRTDMFKVMGRELVFQSAPIAGSLLAVAYKSIESPTADAKVSSLYASDVAKEQLRASVQREIRDLPGQRSTSSQPSQVRVSSTALSSQAARRVSPLPTLNQPALPSSLNMLSRAISRNPSEESAPAKARKRSLSSSNDTGFEGLGDLGSTSAFLDLKADSQKTPIERMLSPAGSRRGETPLKGKTPDSKAVRMLVERLDARDEEAP